MFLVVYSFIHQLPDYIIDFLFDLFWIYVLLPGTTYYSFFILSPNLAYQNTNHVYFYQLIFYTLIENSLIYFIGMAVFGWIITSESRK